MPNMSYCRFENTARDLEDCWRNWRDFDEDGEPLNQFEREGKARVVELARLIVEREGAA